MGFDLRRGLFIDLGEGDRKSATFGRIESKLLISAEQTFRVPKAFELVSELPLNASDKVFKTELRKV